MQFNISAGLFSVFLIQLIASLTSQSPGSFPPWRPPRAKDCIPYQRLTSPIVPNYKNLFLEQSYQDAYRVFEKSLADDGYLAWDYVILTASNQAQAEAYREQIGLRLDAGKLAGATHYAVLPDPDGKRVGSGGATLNAMRYIREHSGRASFRGLRCLIIHSGGDSKRVPQYSACGKLFSPVPRVLPDGRRSTLFDELIISMTSVPGRIADGMMVCSGDVLLLFNVQQLDFYSRGAVALSMKESAQTGKDHGVFSRDENGNVGRFLHKQSVSTLEAAGAVDELGNVHIDTGAVIFDSNVLDALYRLIDTDEKFRRCVNDRVRLSFYGDFLYPLASGSTLDQYYLEQPEGEFSDALTECRKAIWKLLSEFRMKLICFSPSSFIHFGTTRELLQLVSRDIDTYCYLGWTALVNTNASAQNIAASNSYISSNDAHIGAGSYIEDSVVHHGTKIGDGCVVSGVVLGGDSVPSGAVLHGLRLKSGKYVARMYGVDDNPKQPFWFGKRLQEPLWTAKLFKACDTMEEAVSASLSGASDGILVSLQESFRDADIHHILDWQRQLGDYVRVERLMEAVRRRDWFENAHFLFTYGVSDRVLQSLEAIAEKADFSAKIRIYYYLSRYCGAEERKRLENLCFDTICWETLSSAYGEETLYNRELRIGRESALARLPVRVNWGGGWSDTLPYSIEHGGTVLNAAVTLHGEKPISASIKRLDAYKVVLSSADFGSYEEFTDLAPLQSCRSPYDPYALPKAALVACGVIPMQATGETLEDILRRLGGGIALSTNVVNIPRGSGLGTSSILAGACVSAISEFMGTGASESDMYGRVLCLEQIMSTGGGWQDQVGGLTAGIKMVTSTPGLQQRLTMTPLRISLDTVRELQSRFCLIYTGQRRLARNLLREIVGKYIGGHRETVDVLYEIQRLAVLMRFELEKGNIDGFTELLNDHWELSKRLDRGCTNTCIEQIFNTCEDLIDGRMICGAGGGGYLQVVLKQGVPADALRQRLNSVFLGSGVEVATCTFVGYDC